jgi:hypothetical protein
MKTKYILNNVVTMLLLVVLLTACEEEGYETPTPKNALQNDCIKRSLGPNVAGQPIEFTYAMALPKSLGRLTEARVEASIPGAAGTYLENRAFYTNGSGVDVPVVVGNPSATEGTLTTVTFTADTFATTLRYFYIAPPEARGQSVRFKFSATATNGATVSYDMGPYTVSNMDMILDKNVSDNNVMYISIEDMEVYNAAQAAANPDKIDLVYLFRTVNRPGPTGATVNVFGHALVAPAADASYLPGVTLPAGVDNNTRIVENMNLRDRHLARGQWGVYIDDVDFQKLDVSTAPNFAINVKTEGGVWVETEDGRYRAFVYINQTAAGTMRISMKRLQML